MKKVSSILWGIVLILLGTLFAINALEIIDFNFFFDGWWTLFIIIPCAISLFSGDDKVGSLIGIAIGIFLLLCCQNVLDFTMLWKLLIPVIIIIVGIKMIITAIFAKKSGEIFNKLKTCGGNLKNGTAVFSGSDLIFNGEIFEGAELNAVFGGVKCDLRGAIIEKDAAIKFSAIFGGIDILVPENVNVKVNSTSIFGGVSNKAQYSKDNAITIYINGNCMFGGVDIK